MLPDKYVELDKEWIEEQISKLDHQLRAKVCMKYTEVFTEAYDSTELEYQKSNNARRESNTRLRLFVEKFATASLGETIRPPTV